MKINCLLLELHPCEKCDLRSRCFQLWKKKAFDLAKYYTEACQTIAELKKENLDLLEVIKVQDERIEALKKGLMEEMGKCQK